MSLSARIFSFTFLFFFIPRVVHADPVETLIENEKSSVEEWNDQEEELPTLMLFGDANGVEIYSDASSRHQNNLLCEPMEFDELVELSRGRLEDQEVTLNLALPRVREIIEKNCLIRPTDPLVAISQSTQVVVNLKEFVVKKDRSLCPNDSPYSLWMTLEKPLVEAPFFFSTDSHLEGGKNGFRSVDKIPTKKMEGDLQKKCAAKIPFLEDYETIVYDLKSIKCDEIVFLKRRIVTPDDVDLANEMMVWVKGDAVEMFLQEKVNTNKSSGHVRLEGVLDYNQDGLVDVILYGDHDGCTYTALFQGTESEFISVDLPNKPCAC